MNKTFNWVITITVQSSGKEIVRRGEGGFDMAGYARAAAISYIAKPVFWQTLPDTSYLKSIDTEEEKKDEKEK